MNRSACLIFNPVAGQGDPEQELAQIREILEPEIDLDIYMTTEEIAPALFTGATIVKSSKPSSTISPAGP